MDEQRPQPKYMTYGAIFAVLLYFGAIVPWQDELALARKKLDEERELAANPTRVLALAKRAREGLQARQARRDASLQRLLGGLANPSEACPSAAETFAIVVATAAELGMDAPDLRPLDTMANSFLSASGCSFSVEVDHETKIYRLLRALEAHGSRPRLRSLSLEERRARKGARPSLNARIVLSWPRLTKAGADRLRLPALPSLALAEEERVASWALFDARPLPPTPEGGESQAAEEASTSVPETAPTSEVIADGVPERTEEETKPPEASLVGVKLEGTITIAGIDGIIATVGGKSTILQLGDEVAGYTLDRVKGSRAVFSGHGKQLELLLDRKTLVGDGAEAAKETPPPSPIAARPKLGLRASFVPCQRVSGGQNLAGKGFRRGLLVRSVSEDSLAAQLRLCNDDLIYAINGKKIRTPTQLRQATASARSGKPLTFRVLRRGVPMEIASAP